MSDHEIVLVHFDAEHIGTPAEVCWTCSSPDAGVWVPVSLCPQAAALLPRDAWDDDYLGFGSSYTPSSARSILDQEPYDPQERWEQYA